MAPAILLLVASSSGFAGIAANGSFGFSILGCCSLDGGAPGTGDLLLAATVDWQSPTDNGVIVTNDATTFGSPNDFQSLFLSSVTLNPAGFNKTLGFNPMTLTFGPGAIYSFNATFENQTVNVGVRSVSLYFLGTFHDSTGAFNDGLASLSLSFTQSAPESSVSGSGTFSTPPVSNPSAPEPATLTMMGSALIGLGVLGRKRFNRK